jgi:hypothetical protein
MLIEWRGLLDCGSYLRAGTNKLAITSRDQAGVFPFQQMFYSPITNRIDDRLKGIYLFYSVDLLLRNLVSNLQL